MGEDRRQETASAAEIRRLRHRMRCAELGLVALNDNKFASSVYRDALQNQIKERVFTRVRNQLGLIGLIIGAGYMTVLTLYAKTTIDSAIKSEVTTTAPALIDQAVAARISGSLQEHTFTLLLEQHAAYSKLDPPTIGPEYSTQLEQFLLDSGNPRHPLLVVNYSRNSRDPRLRKPLVAFCHANPFPEMRQRGFEALAAAYTGRSVRRDLVQIMTAEESGGGEHLSAMLETLARSIQHRSDTAVTDYALRILGEKGCTPQARVAAHDLLLATADPKTIADAALKLSAVVRDDDTMLTERNRSLVRILEDGVQTPTASRLMSDFLDGKGDEADADARTAALAYFIALSEPGDSDALENVRLAQDDPWNALHKARLAVRSPHQVESTAPRAITPQESAGMVAALRSLFARAGAEGSAQRQFIRHCWFHLALERLDAGDTKPYLALVAQVEIPPDVWLARIKSIGAVQSSPFAAESAADVSTVNRFNEFLRVAEYIPELGYITPVDRTIKELQGGELSSFLDLMSTSYYPHAVWKQQILPLFPGFTVDDVVSDQEQQDSLWRWVEREGRRLEWDGSRYQMVGPEADEYARMQLQDGDLGPFLAFMAADYFDHDEWQSSVLPRFPDVPREIILGSPHAAQDALWQWVERQRDRLSWDVSAKEFRLQSPQEGSEASPEESSLQALKDGDPIPFVEFMSMGYYDDDVWRQDVRPMFPDAPVSTPDGNTEDAQDELALNWVVANASKLRWDEEELQYRLREDAEQMSLKDWSLAELRQDRPEWFVYFASEAYEEVLTDVEWQAVRAMFPDAPSRILEDDDPETGPPDLALWVQVNRNSLKWHSESGEYRRGAAAETQPAASAP